LVPDAEAIHYGGASSANSPVRFYVEMQRADFQYWGKHHSWPARWVYFALVTLHMGLRAAGYWLALRWSRHAREERQHKLDRSLACLRWMRTETLRQPGGVFFPSAPGHPDSSVGTVPDGSLSAAGVE
jgi:hypothetical protein